MKLLLYPASLVLLLSSFFVPQSDAHGGHEHGPGGHGHGELPPDQAKLAKTAIDAYRLKKLSGVRLGDIVVPICFHLLYATDTTKVLTEADLQAQLDHLNAAFSDNSCCDIELEWCEEGMCSLSSRFVFAMAVMDDSEDGLSGETTPFVNDTNACVTNTTSDDWADGDTNYKEFTAALHRGGWETMNTYVASELSGGASFYPWRAEAETDGVYLSFRSLPGNEDISYNGEGDTMVHEVGHWVGLPHTFAHGCEASDGILDTPREGEEGDECQPGRDTCPDHPGTDPVHNFMNYGYDECTYEFTAGQIEYMEAVYAYYRARDDWTEDDLNEIPLVLGVPSDPIAMYGAYDVQLYTFETTGCCFNCTAVASEGDARMYIRFDEDPSYSSSSDDCASDGDVPYDQYCNVVMDDSKIVASSEEVEATQGPVRGLIKRICGGGGDGGNDASGCATTCESTKVYVGMWASYYTDRSGVNDLVVTCNECCI